MLHGALALTEHARAEVLAIDTDAALALPGVVAVFTAADIPGELRVGIIHTDWPVMIPVGGRTSYLGDVLAIVVAETRQAAREARRRSSTRRLRRPPPAHRPGRRHRRPRAGRVGHRLERAERVDLPPRRRRRGVGGQSAPRARGVPDPADRARLPRARVDARRSPSRRRPARVLGRPGRVGRPQPDRLGPGPRHRPGHGRARVERRRVRRQGGHEQPGADRAGGLAAAAAGEVHADPRAVAAHAPQAPPDPPRVPRRLRRRGPPHRASRRG